MKRAISIVFLISLTVFASPAAADTILDFTITDAFFVNGSPSPSLTGTFSVDVTTDILTAYDVTAAATPSGTCPGCTYPAEHYVFAGPGAVPAGNSVGPGGNFLTLYDGTAGRTLQLQFASDLFTYLTSPGAGMPVNIINGISCLIALTCVEPNSLEVIVPGAPGGGDCGVSNCSRDIDDVNHHPYVTAGVSAAVPEPGSLLLLGSGLVGLGAWRRMMRTRS